MYRTIETSTWSDPDFDGLKSSAKLLFLYFVTNEHTHSCGIYHCRRLWILNETGLPQDAIEKSMDALSELGMVMFDPETEVVWVRNMMKHQGQNSKLRAAARRHVKTLHKSCLIKQFLEQYPAVCKDKKARCADASSDVGEVCLQKQEQKQEQNNKNGCSAAERAELIEAVYQAYPRKVAKGAAIKAIEAAVRRISERQDRNTPEWLLDRTRGYAGAVSRCGERGADVETKTPHPATWFNGFRYDDPESEWTNTLMAGVSNGRPQLRIAGTQPDHRAAKRANEYPEPEDSDIPNLLAIASSAAVSG